jgi:glyoxylase-like metal-dependent hydrolase (beta-lactamase superfamily II)
MRNLLAIGLLATSLAACAPQPPAVKLYVMECGRFQISDMGVFADNHALDGIKRDLIDTCYLIRHPKGDLMWDAGLPDALAAQADGVTQGPFHMTVPKTLASQLSEMKVRPEDIEFLALSHSHLDHTGNAAVFAGAKWLSNPVERAFMFSDEAKQNAEQYAAVAPLEKSVTVDIATDHDVFGDGTVRLIQTPGHTPGHMSLLVRLKKAGPILLTGDLYHTQEAREQKLVPTFNTDRGETLVSMEKFEKLAVETKARVIIQHKMEDFDALPHAPAFLV